MDEVLNALKEKEAQMEAANNDKMSNGSPVDRPDGRGFADRGFSERFSASPPRDISAPPPLPPHPPKAEAPITAAKPDSHKKQAKVKPMSTSDEKLIDDAINKANELVSHSGRAELARQESLGEKHSDNDSSHDSPKLLQKLKASIKRSPKHERKRTFSDSLNREMEDDIPPEAQEAYNMLVVHGSVKDGSRGYHSHGEGSKPTDSQSLGSNGSGHNFAFADSSSSSASRTPDRTSPLKSMSRQSSERSSMSPPNLSRLPSEGTPDRPTPRPRIDTPPRRSEIPVPKPRAEILRVEPTPRPPPPPVPTKSAHVMEETAAAAAAASAAPSYNTATYSTSNTIVDNSLLIQEDKDWKQSDDSLKFNDRTAQAEVLRVDLPDEKPDRLNTSFESGRKSTSPSEESQSSSSKISFFDEEVSDPSPREIMSKLARESRLRRSLDHQRGGGDADVVVMTRNIREPQGIPAKKPSIPAATEEEEEVDTNPLRMLRGGMIPVRGGRGGSGRRLAKK